MTQIPYTDKERELLLLLAKRVIPGIRTEPGYDLIRQIEAEAKEVMPTDAHSAAVPVTSPVATQPEPAPGAQVACSDCGAPYGKDGWCDVIIPDAIWNTISEDGCGVLCFRCMTRRLEQHGFSGVPVIVASGPYKDANEEWRLIGWDHGYKVAKEEFSSSMAAGSGKSVISEDGSTPAIQLDTPAAMQRAREITCDTTHPMLPITSDIAADLQRERRETAQRVCNNVRKHFYPRADHRYPGVQIAEWLDEAGKAEGV